MGLEFETETQAAERSQREGGGRRYRIPERLYKTQDDRIVLEGDPDANSLFKRAGDTIPMPEAIELGLVKRDEKEESVKESSGNKKGKTAANKQRKPAQNKGAVKASK